MRLVIFPLYYQDFQCSFFYLVWQNSKGKEEKNSNNYIKSALPDKDGMTAQTELLAVRRCHRTLVQNAR